MPEVPHEGGITELPSKASMAYSADYEEISAYTFFVLDSVPVNPRTGVDWCAKRLCPKRVSAAASNRGYVG